MTSPIEAAVNRLSELKAEQAELETFIRVYYRLCPHEKLAAILPNGPKRYSSVEAVEKYVDKPVDNAQLGGVSLNFDATKVPPMRVDDNIQGEPRAKLANAKEIFGEIFERLIREAGRPLTRGEMLERIEAMPDAPPLNSDDNSKYLGTLLWRNRHRFRNLPGHGYWLKDQPYYLASYDPVTAESDTLDTEGETFSPDPLPSAAD